MEKAYKFRFYPTKTQITILNCTFGCVRYVYNHFLGLKQELYNKEKKSMSYNQCSKALTLLKQEKEWLKDVTELISSVAELLGLKDEDDSSEELGLKSEIADKGLEDFDSREEYISYLKDDVELD